MHDTMRVGVSERTGEILQEPLGVSNGEPAGADKQAAQRPPLDERHGIPEPPGIITGIEYGKYEGMLQAGSEGDLAPEARRAVVAEGVAQDLQRNLALVAEVACTIHERHAAPPDRVQHLVSGVEYGT